MNDIEKSMRLANGWYVVADSREVKAGKSLGLKRFGKALVLWRTKNGSVIIMDDRCPHRFAGLSGGDIVNDKIVCPYHGFEFDCSGSCTNVPETGKSATNLKVTTYNTREVHGFIWIWIGESPQSEIPWFSDINDSFTFCQFEETWNCHFTRCVENQLDYAHLPIVHKTTIGRFVSSPKNLNVEFELSEERIKFSPSSRAFIEFLFPNIWRNFISPGFQLVLAFVPISDDQTKLYLRSYYRFPKIPIVSTIIAGTLNYTNKKILSQDRAVVLSQIPNSSMDPRVDNEAPYPSDRAVKFYREVLQKITPGY